MRDPSCDQRRRCCRPPGAPGAPARGNSHFGSSAGGDLGLVGRGLYSRVSRVRNSVLDIGQALCNALFSGYCTDEQRSSLLAAICERSAVSASVKWSVPACCEV